jgi:hypothetical protein
MAKKKNPRRRLSKFFYILGFFAVLVVVLTVSSKIGLKPSFKCANSISCIKDLSGNYQPQKQSVFMGRVVTAPSYVAENIVQKTVLGDATGEKHIFVNITKQELHAYQGEKLVISFPISSGKWRPTPTGDFRIWIKLRNAHMEGGEGADYYNLYNVPYTMFYYNDKVPKSFGFSLHGAYWHNNFGYPMSHGCVNIRPEDAQKLYDFADPQTEGNTTYATNDNPGTLVTIYEEPTSNK